MFVRKESYMTKTNAEKAVIFLSNAFLIRKKRINKFFQLFIAQESKPGLVAKVFSKSLTEMTEPDRKDRIVESLILSRHR